MALGTSPGIAETEPMTGTSVPVGSIVVGVDGSEHAERALAWAVEQARLAHRHLALVHCAPHTEAPGILSDAARAVGSPRRRRRVLGAPDRGRPS